MSDFETKVLAALEALQGGQAELRSDVAELRAGQAELRAEMAALRPEMAALRSWLELELAAVWKAVESLQRAFEEHRADTLAMRTAIMDRIDRLQNTLTKAKDEMIVQTGGIDLLRTMIAADRAAIANVQDVVALLQRKIARLEERFE